MVDGEPVIIAQNGLLPLDLVPLRLMELLLLRAIVLQRDWCRLSWYIAWLTTAVGLSPGSVVE